MKRLILISSIAAILGACAPHAQTSHKEDPTPIPVRRAPFISPRSVEERIAYLDRIASSDTISQNKKEIANTVKQHYHAFLSILNSSPSEQEEREGLTELMAALEVEMGALLTEREPPTKIDCRTILKESLSATHEIIGLYKKGDFNAVIIKCQDFRTRFGDDALTTELTSACALSLASLGRTKEAIELSEPLARLIKENEELYRLGDQIPRWRGESETQAARSREHANLATLLSKAEALAGKGDFDEAEEMINKARSDFKEESSLYEIEKALESLKEKRDRFVEERIEAVSRRADVIREAQDLAAQERPEEALDRLKTLEKQLGSSDPDAEAVARQAIEAIIARERNRAARLFLQAKDTQNSAEREQLLLLARGILKSVIERYPDAPSAKKAAENLLAVEREISSLKKPPADK
jgi:tetratricopeptide (TPR) repeat protein